LPCSGAESYYNVGGETEGACGNSIESGKMLKLSMTRKLIKRMKGEQLRRKKERWAGMKKKRKDKIG